MEFSLVTISLEETVNQVMAVCGDISKHGYLLTRHEATELAQAGVEALKEMGRVAIGPSVLPALLEAFCDSAYLPSTDSVEILAALTQLFYRLKNETEFSDRLLLENMRRLFDLPCQGAMDKLEEMPLEWFVTPPTKEILLRQTDTYQNEEDLEIE